MLLPFALIPLLKFIGDEKVMGDFALPAYSHWFAIIFGFALYLFNALSEPILASLGLTMSLPSCGLDILDDLIENASGII